MADRDFQGFKKSKPSLQEAADVCGLGHQESMRHPFHRILKGMVDMEWDWLQFWRRPNLNVIGVFDSNDKLQVIHANTLKTPACVNPIKRAALIDRIEAQGLAPGGQPSPVVSLEEFFEGNDDTGSIGCNLSLPGPQYFYDILKGIRSRPGVQDVLVAITDLDAGDDFWPFSDRVYVLADASAEGVATWAEALQPDTVEEGITDGKPDIAVEVKPGFTRYRLWWD